MLVKYKSPGPFEARLVTESNLESIAEWCGGRVRGTKLPAADRIVQWDRRGEEIDANVGEWIVDKKLDGFHVYSQTHLNMIFDKEGE